MHISWLCFFCFLSLFLLSSRHLIYHLISHYHRIRSESSFKELPDHPSSLWGLTSRKVLWAQVWQIGLISACKLSLRDYGKSCLWQFLFSLAFITPPPSQTYIITFLYFVFLFLIYFGFFVCPLIFKSLFYFIHSSLLTISIYFIFLLSIPLWIESGTVSLWKLTAQVFWA